MTTRVVITNEGPETVELFHLDPDQKIDGPFPAKIVMPPGAVATEYVYKQRQILIKEEKDVSCSGF